MSYEPSAFSFSFQQFAVRPLFFAPAERDFSVVILSDEVAVATEESKDPYVAQCSRRPARNKNANSLSFLLGLCHYVNGDDGSPVLY